MKKILLGLVAMATAVNAGAQTDDADSLKMEKLNEVVVSSVRSQKNAPYAVTNLKKKELSQFSTSGQELPFLFARTPGVLAWSENGLGTGTVYMRIRGAADSRINVTLDGVPLNSPEDQCVFWANMNSYGSLLGSVQIQRGVGTSTNGDGAFGGSISMMSHAPQTRPSAEVSGSYGSYGTFNVGGQFSTGLLWNHLVLDGAYHETQTDGFIHGTNGRSGSYYGGLTWLDERFKLSYKNFGNFEKTGQAWNGVTAGNDDMSLMEGSYATPTGIKTYKDLWDAGLGRYNSLYEHLVTGDDGLFKKDDNGNYLTERYTMADGSYWDKTTDNFWQNHNILSASWNINDRWSTSASLHYTHGHGYYSEFRPQNKIKKLGLPNEEFGYEVLDGIKRTDWVRKKGLTQDTYGLVWSINYKDDSWDIIGGLNIQNFSGNHYGYATYVSGETLRKLLLSKGDYKYYDSDAKKFDGSAYVKAAYAITPAWSVFADVQYRHVGYKTDGYNDKFIYNKQTYLYYKHFLDIDAKYDFFNPKAGFSWQQNGHRVYGSVALGHREPERNNFTDNGKYPAPKAESLLDYELGYTYNADIWHFGLNAYYMDYTNQFVQTGELTEIGEKLTTNIKDSYRMGLELQAGVAPTSWLTIEGNAALSQNKIKDFDEFVEDWDDWDYKDDAAGRQQAMAMYHIDGNGDELRQIHYSKSTLAFSPSVILNGFVNLHYKGWQAVWHTNFVSRQYLDNTENCDRSLPGYSVSNVSLSYTLKPKKVMKEAIFGLNLNNVFNHRYAASGWVYSAIAESYGHTNDNRYYQIGFIPMAGRTMMGTVTLRF